MGECLMMRRGGETYKLPVLNPSYPQDVTTTVIKGNTTSATFSAVISEAGNPAEYTYQWYVDGVAMSGATNSSYTKSGLGTTATHSVYCKITNKAGSVETRVATLKVTQYYTPVLNASYPADVTGASVGGSATFTVAIATAGVPASYTYQWYVNGSKVSGATGASYTKNNLARGSYTVYCEVTNSAGTVQSRIATLTVTKEYLYNYGDECTELTGGWKGTNATLTKGNKSMKIAVAKNVNGYGRTSKPISMVDRKNLTVVFDVYATSENVNETSLNQTFILRVLNSAGTVVSSKELATLSVFQSGSAAKNNQTVSLDISALNGAEYYVDIYSYGVGNIYTSGHVLLHELRME